MSAWFVTKGHIDAMVQATIMHKLTALQDADETGRMLWGENCKSLRARYSQADENWDFSGIDSYQFEGIEAKLDPYIMYMQAHCYNYQTCEHEDYEESEAYALCVRLCQALALEVSALDVDTNGNSDIMWDRSKDAPWGVSSIKECVQQ